MTIQEIIAQLEIMARAVYGDEAWVGCNQVTGYSVWYNSRDIALSTANLDEVKAFLIQENEDSQKRFNDALERIGG